MSARGGMPRAARAALAALLAAGCAPEGAPATLARHPQRVNGALPMVLPQRPFDFAGVPSVVVDLAAQVQPSGVTPPSSQAVVEFLWGTEPDLLTPQVATAAPSLDGIAHTTLWGLQDGATYYWRTRLVDPTEADPVGEPSPVSSFTVLPGRKAWTWHQTTTPQFGRDTLTGTTADWEPHAVRLAPGPPVLLADFTSAATLGSAWSVAGSGGAVTFTGLPANLPHLTTATADIGANVRVQSSPGVLAIPTTGRVAVTLSTTVDGPTLWILSDTTGSREPLMAIGIVDGGFALRDGAGWRPTGVPRSLDGGAHEIGLEYDSTQRRYGAYVDGALRGRVAFLSDAGVPAQVVFGMTGGQSPQAPAPMAGKSEWWGLTAADQLASGTVETPAIDLAALGNAKGAVWGSVDWSTLRSDGGQVLVQVQQPVGNFAWTPVPDTVLPGNKNGVPGPVVNLAALNGAGVRSIRLQSLLLRGPGSGPALLDWTVTFQGSQLTPLPGWQTADAGAEATLTARVQDDLFVGLPNVEVRFTQVLDAGVEVPAGTVLTDAAGQVKVQVQTTPRPATNVYLARADVVRNPVVRFEVDTRAKAVGPPVFTSTPPLLAQCGAEWTYQATTSPAGTWTLQNAPAGATIDAATGLLRWTPPAGLVGVTTLTITATNGDGTGSQTVPVTVACEGASPPPDITLSTTCGCGAASGAPLFAAALLAVWRRRRPRR